MTTGHDTLKADGGWDVELIKPLKHSNGTVITTISIRPTELDQTIRWGSQEIPSTLALLSEMSGVPESLLRTLTYPDVDRVMLAYSQVIPTLIRTDFENGSRPFATPDDELSDEDKASVGNAVDPRFPKVAGVVHRYKKPEPAAAPVPTPPAPDNVPAAQQSPPEDDESGLSAAPPEIARKVG